MRPLDRPQLHPPLAFALAVAVAVVTLGAPRSAAAAWPEARCVEALDDAEVEGRLLWLERLFARAERKGRSWFWTWLSLHAAVTAAGVPLAVVEDDPLRRDAFAIVAATSAGMVGLMVTPPLPSGSMLRRFRRMPDATPDQRREKLERSVALLGRAADHERRGRAWYRHAFALTFAATESWFLGVRDRGRPAASIFSGAATLALLEAQIVTTPRAAARAAIDFEYGNRPCMAPQLRAPAEPSLDLVPVPGGIGVGVTW